MGTKKKRVLAAVFETSEGARKAVRLLREEQYDDNEIGLLTRDSHGQPELTSFKDLEGNKSGKSAAIGAAAGAGGGVLWAIGIAVGVLPAIGPVIAGGVLAAIAASAGIGAATGVVVGALVGLGISDEEAAYYDEEFRKGRTIVVVQTAKNPDLAYRILNEYRQPDTYLRDPFGTDTEPPPVGRNTLGT